MVNERALIEAFQNIKKEFQSIRKDIDEINSRLNNANGHTQQHTQQNTDTESQNLTSIQEQLEKLNYAEESLFESMENITNPQVQEHQERQEHQEFKPATKIKKNPIKEVDEFIEGGLDVDTDDLADEYY